MPKRFDPRKYRRQNQVYGVPVRWWKAQICDCVDPSTGAPSETCTLCEANGRRYIEQTIPLSSFDGKPCRALLFETETELVDHELGAIKQGSTAIAVMPDELPLTRLDRIMPIDAQFVEGKRQTVQRGADAIDRLENRPVISIPWVARRETVYQLGRDYVVHETGIEWLDGPGAIAPDAGQMYAIEYQAGITFTLVDVHATIRANGDGGALPVEFVLTR
jgi:hypothetical protein